MHGLLPDSSHDLARRQARGHSEGCSTPRPRGVSGLDTAKTRWLCPLGIRVLLCVGWAPGTTDRQANTARTTQTGLRSQSRVCEALVAFRSAIHHPAWRTHVSVQNTLQTKACEMFLDTLSTDYRLKDSTLDKLGTIKC